MKTLLIALFGMLFVFSGVASSLTLAWNANPELNIKGYWIAYGTSSGVYTNGVSVGKVTTYTLQGLTNNVTYYIGLAAINKLNIQSDFTEIKVFKRGSVPRNLSVK
jgi:hypothetical protein